MQATALAAETSPSPTRKKIDLALGVGLGSFVAFALALSLWKDSLWGDTLPFLATLGAPMLLIAVRSWRRWFHPERLPARWPAGSRSAQRWQSAAGCALLLGVMLNGFAIVALQGPHHRSARDAIQTAFWAIYLWYWVMQSYIQDRVPLVPRIRDTAIAWPSDMKPVQSNQWGAARRAIRKAGQPVQ
jgi:hypothetical protein